MKKTTRGRISRAAALLLIMALMLSMFTFPAFAGQENGYHDPAEHWQSSGGRGDDLDANAVVTREVSNCVVCGRKTTFTVWRVPEYSRDGVTALSRNVLYSDGTMRDGESTGSILSGLPGVNATYTGYHWSKCACEVCGTMNSVSGPGHYGFGKSVYNLYECSDPLMKDLPETVTYAWRIR